MGQQEIADEDRGSSPVDAIDEASEAAAPMLLFDEEVIMISLNYIFFLFSVYQSTNVLLLNVTSQNSKIPVNYFI